VLERSEGKRSFSPRQPPPFLVQISRVPRSLSACLSLLRSLGQAPSGIGPIPPPGSNFPYSPALWFRKPRRITPSNPPGPPFWTEPFGGRARRALVPLPFARTGSGTLVSPPPPPPPLVRSPWGSSFSKYHPPAPARVVVQPSPLARRAQPAKRRRGPLCWWGCGLFPCCRPQRIKPGQRARCPLFRFELLAAHEGGAPGFPPPPPFRAGTHFAPEPIRRPRGGRAGAPPPPPDPPRFSFFVSDPKGPLGPKRNPCCPPPRRFPGSRGSFPLPCPPQKNVVGGPASSGQQIPSRRSPPPAPAPWAALETTVDNSTLPGGAPPPLLVGGPPPWPPHRKRDSPRPQGPRRRNFF